MYITIENQYSLKIASHYCDHKDTLIHAVVGTVYDMPESEHSFTTCPGHNAVSILTSRHM